MNKKNKEILMLVLRCAVAMAIFVLAVVNYDRLKNIDVRSLVSHSANIYFAIGAILGVYLVKSVLFIIPASLIYISVGMAFSPLTAIMINLAGIVLEVVVTYFLGLFLGGAYVNNLLSKNKAGRKILEKNISNKIPVLLGVRALPVFPIDFVSLFLGSTKCTFWKYFTASVVGIMPRVALFTILGDGIYDYIPIHLIVKIIIAAIPLGVIVYLIRFILKKRKVSKGESGKNERDDREEICTPQQ